MPSEKKKKAPSNQSASKKRLHELSHTQLGDLDQDSFRDSLEREKMPTGESGFSVRVFNSISKDGLSLFPKDWEVGPDVAEPDAILLRSQVLESEDIPKSVLGIARAGAGVNNIPTERMTERGVVVLNTPGANANAVCELVLAAMLIQTRNLFSSIRYISELKPDKDVGALNKKIEAQKKGFRGGELSGRTLGIVGLGAIGSLLASKALDMGMEVVGFDPALSVSAAWRLPNSVMQTESLEEMVGMCDFLSLHIPVLDSTRNIIDKKILSHCKKGAYILNFARGPIVDDGAVIKALDTGLLSGYSTDFPTSDLLKRSLDASDVHLYPHLGASTAEAESNCAMMAVEQLVNFLRDGNIVNSVNFPQTRSRRQGKVRLCIANANVPSMLGQITQVFAELEINVVNLVNKSREQVAFTLIDLETKPPADIIQQIRSIDGALLVRLI